MNSRAQCPEPTFLPGEKFLSFKIIRVEQIPEIRITGYEIIHEPTGAKVIHLHSDDKENLYAIGFRTPPRDSTGVPHILEHSVLAGSKKYPLKDVFNELMKGTLQTFINAFTYPDKTVYPVASQTKTDFYNLARVYTDLVLNPRLLKETFMQEGYHFEFSRPDDAESDLIVSGIVYNEMKGAYSSPDSLMYKLVQENLYPNTTYAFDAGGNPEDIPTLTYEKFLNFHRTYYSPTNARFFFYGNIPTREHLTFLSEMLADFKPVEVNSSIPDQPRWERASYAYGTFPIGKDESVEKKTTVNIAWMLTDTLDYETVLLLRIASTILIGSAAGPLRKALIDSGLGEDLSPISGLECDLKQIAFIIGLRGTDTDKASQIEKIILDTLEKCSESGIDSELIEGALHQVEFHGKEIIRDVFPYGIVLMNSVFTTWLYDGDPFVGLKFPILIENIRRKWREKPELFQDVIREWFLQNPHRLLTVLAPSKDHQSEREKAYREKMVEIKASLSREEREKIHIEADALKKFQSEPDPPEAIAMLPKLKTSDIPRAVETIPTEKEWVDEVPVMCHDIFTNGIAYLDVAFDVGDISEDLQPYLPLLGKLIVHMGAAGLRYDEMAKRIMMKTGGISYHLSTGMTVDGQKSWQKIIFRMKSLYRNIADSMRIVSDLLTETDFTDATRMRELIQERKNNLHASVIPSGHIFARRTASAAYSTATYRDEQWHGRTQLRFIYALSEHFDDVREELIKKLIYLKDTLMRRGRLYLNLTADSEGLSRLRDHIVDLVKRVPEGGKPKEASIPYIDCTNYGIIIPSQVAYVARVFPAPPYNDTLSAPILALAKLLSSGYLYKHIRVQGGAYGGMSQYDPTSKVLAFLSYRDPHIVETLKVYSNAVNYIRETKVTREELEKTIIGTIGALDRPMDPSTRGYTAMIREFAELTDDHRSKFRSTILDLTPEQMQDAAIRYFTEVTNLSAIAVYAGDEHMSKALEFLEQQIKVESLI